MLTKRESPESLDDILAALQLPYENINKRFEEYDLAHEDIKKLEKGIVKSKEQVNAMIQEFKKQHPFHSILGFANTFYWLQERAK